VALADDILTQLAHVDVIQCRTGIVMLPYRDTAKGVTFHLGDADDIAAIQLLGETVLPQVANL
jgi:hypothetical protein